MRVFTRVISYQDETRPGKKSNLSMVKCLLLFPTVKCLLLSKNSDKISSWNENRKKDVQALHPGMKF